MLALLTRSSPLRTISHTCGCVRKVHNVLPAKTPIWVALSLQRLPIITAPLTPVEEKMQTLLLKQEIDMSLLCDHELKLAHEREQLDAAKAAISHHSVQTSSSSGTSKTKPTSSTKATSTTSSAAKAKPAGGKPATKAVPSKANLDHVKPKGGSSQSTESLLSTVEKENLWREAAGEFKPAPRETPEDLNGVFNTLWRKLDRQLLLLLKLQTEAGLSYWGTPSALWQHGETLRQTAERIAQTHLPASISYRILSNAPCVVGDFLWPRPAKQGGPVQCKIFYYKALLPRQLLDLPEEFGNEKAQKLPFAFVCKEEIEKFVPQSKYCKTLRRTIFEV